MNSMWIALTNQPITEKSVATILDQREYNLLTQRDSGEKPLQPPLFRKESTSELTAKTKGSDRIFRTKLGLSQSLMVQ